MELLIGGPIILGYLALTYAFATWAFRWTKRRGFGALGKSTAVLGVLFIAWAIPFGDYTIGLIKFTRLCGNQGGTRIDQTVQGVDGFMWDTGRQAKPYTTYGYRFSETRTQKNELYRYVLRTEGIVEEDKVDTPKAKFLARGGLSEVGGHIRAYEFVIMDMETGRNLASYKTFHYRGGWLYRSLSGIGVTGPHCPDTTPQFVPSKFVQSVLIPSS